MKSSLPTATAYSGPYVYASAATMADFHHGEHVGGGGVGLERRPEGRRGFARRPARGAGTTNVIGSPPSAGTTFTMFRFDFLPQPALSSGFSFMLPARECCCCLFPQRLRWGVFPVGTCSASPTPRWPRRGLGRPPTFQVFPVGATGPRPLAPPSNPSSTRWWRAS